MTSVNCHYESLSAEVIEVIVDRMPGMAGIAIRMAGMAGIRNLSFHRSISHSKLGWFSARIQPGDHMAMSRLVG